MSSEVHCAVVDWEGERRWYDPAWARIAVVLLVYAGLIAGWSLWLPDNPGGFGGGLAASAGVTWQTLAIRRQVAAETGLKTWQVPVASRRLRQGRIPRDPAARHAMALLARRQRTALERGRWMNPALAVVFGMLGIACLVTSRTALGTLALVAAAGVGTGAVAGRRALRRLDRIEKQLSPPPPPLTTGPVYGS
ncbi:hypothetical protein [Streptomyces sp. IBSBF 2435]|uniref:hypothetical protein n=1 Tax=Streptomyces sp. IBSBF 2435 TaxID=2903531 RepID=UPI002FDBAA02